MHIYPTGVIQEIIMSLCDATETILNRQKELLIQQNAELGGNPDGFLLGGHYFTKLTDQVKKWSAIKKPLHKSLYPAGIELLEATQDLKGDMKQLTQSLSVVLFDCRTPQDVRNALPDCITYILSEFQSYTRTKDEAWTLKNKPLQMMGYPKTAKLLKMYNAMRILQ